MSNRDQILPEKDHQVFLARWASQVIVYRRWILVTVMLVTLLAIFFSTHLRIVIDPAAILPQSHPFVSSKSILEGIFGERYTLAIMVTPKHGEITQPEVLGKVKRITDLLYRTEGVVKTTLLSAASNNARVILGNKDGFETKRFREVFGDTATFHAWLKANPIYQSTIVSKDLGSMAILAQFEPDPQGYDAILKRVQPILDQERDDLMTIQLGGHINSLGNIERYSERMFFLVPLAILLIGLIHYEAFRSLQGLVLPLVTATLALIWVLGVMGASGLPLDVFNVSTPILVLAVAAGHAVQILKRYYEEYDSLRSSTTLSPMEANRQAVVISVAKVGRIMMLAGGVAAIGFFSLTVFEIRTIKVFGIFTGFGIISALVIEFTFIPALRSWLQPPIYPNPTGKKSIWDAMIEKIATFSLTKKSPLLWLLLVSLGVAGASQVKIENSNKANFEKWTSVRQEDSAINQAFAGTQTFYIMVDTTQPDGIKQPEVMAGIEQMTQTLAAVPGVGKVVSIADHLKRMHQAMNGDAPNQYVLPDSRDLIAQYLLLYSIAGDSEDLSSFIDFEYRRANIKVFVKRDDSTFIQELVGKAEILAKAFPNNVRIFFGGGVAEVAALNEVMVRDKLFNILQIGTVVFVISSFVFRSIVAGLLVLLPLVLAVVINFGLLGWSGIPLNIPTSLISAMAVGIGADYAIYLIARYREEVERSNWDTAYATTLATAGKACLYVASAVAIGYGVLALSFGFKVHQWLAMLIASAMFVSAFAALTLVPAIIHRYKPRFIFEKGEQP